MLGKVVPVCPGYLNMRGAKERRFLALQMRCITEVIAGLQPPPQCRIRNGSAPGGWLALLGPAGQYSLLAGEGSGSHVLVGIEVLQSLGEFPTNWAIN